MRYLAVLALCCLGVLSTAFSAHVAANSFSIAVPGDINDVMVTEANTLNGTYHSTETTVVHARDRRAELESSAFLNLDFVNKLASGRINAYITGLDSDNRVVFVKADGTLVYPSSGGSGVPVPIMEDVAVSLPAEGERRLSMRLSIPLTSGRIWIADGELNFFMVKAVTGDGLVQPALTNLRDPSSGVCWTFAELTFTNRRKLFANISFVDFVGLILGISLRERQGRSPQIAHGLEAGSLSKMCQGMKRQGDQDGFPLEPLVRRR